MDSSETNPWMADRMADPDSWQDMVDDWMGEPAGVLCEVDDNLRALNTHADPASFGGGPYPQMRDVDGNYAADGSRFNATNKRAVLRIRRHDS